MPQTLTKYHAAWLKFCTWSHRETRLPMITNSSRSLPIPINHTNPVPFCTPPCILNDMWIRNSLIWFWQRLRKIILFSPLFWYHVLITCACFIFRSNICRVCRVVCSSSQTSDLDPVIFTEWNHLVCAEGMGVARRMRAVSYRPGDERFHCYRVNELKDFW